MNKQNRILLIVLVLQVVLVAATRFADDAPLATKSVAILPDFDADKVEKVEVLGPPAEKDGPPQNSVTLAKVNGQWVIGSADDFVADQARAKELLTNLGKLRARTTVLTGAKYHQKLEVSADKYQRRITVTQGGKDTRFYFGSTPSFKNVHVRLDGKDEVYLVNELSTSDVGDRAWHWVDRTYLKYEPKDLWSIEVGNRSGGFRLDKDPATGEWAALGVTEPLSKNTVDDLVRKAGSYNLETPVGRGLKPEYGLESPLATVTLVTGTSTIAGTPPKETKTVTVQIGNKLDKDNQHYVKASTSDYVVKVASWSLEPLISKSKADLIDKPAPKK